MMMLVPSAGSGDGSTTLLVSFFNLLPLLSLYFSFFLVFFSVLPPFLSLCFFFYFFVSSPLLSFFFPFPLFPSFLLSPSNSLFRVFFSVPPVSFPLFFSVFFVSSPLFCPFFFRSLSSPPFSSLPQTLSFGFSSLFPPSLLSILGSIYRAKGVAFYCSHGEQPAGRPLGATAKVRSVGSRRERGRQKIQIKASFFFLPRCMFGGRRKMNSVV